MNNFLTKRKKDGQVHDSKKNKSKNLKATVLDPLPKMHQNAPFDP